MLGNLETWVSSTFRPPYLEERLALGRGLRMDGDDGEEGEGADEEERASHDDVDLCADLAKK